MLAKNLALSLAVLLALSETIMAAKPLKLEYGFQSVPTGYGMIEICTTFHKGKAKSQFIKHENQTYSVREFNPNGRPHETTIDAEKLFEDCKLSCRNQLDRRMKQSKDCCSVQ